MSRTQKHCLLQQLEEKKIKLKDLQDKCQLQNKKIKLFRKENQDLKHTVDERNQVDTNLLLQSKEMLMNNTKLEKAIEDLKEQLEMAKKSTHLKGKINESSTSNNENDSKNYQVSKKRIGNPVVTVKDVTVTENTFQIDIPNAQLQDQEFLQLEHFQQLKTIIVNDNLLTNQSITVICQRFTSLQKLNIANNKFDSLALQNMKLLQNLKVLDIRNNNLGDEAVRFICALQRLEDLSCCKNSITDKGAQYMESLTNLRYLDITNNQISGSGAWQFTKLQKITHLYLMSNKLTKDGIIDLMRNSKNLQFLDVRFNVWNNDQKQQIKAVKSQKLQVFC